MRKIVTVIFLLAFVWIAFNLPEFYGSQSNAETSKIAQMYHDYMVANHLDVYDVKELNMIFRKLMHFSIYTTITVLSALLVKKLTKKWWAAIIVSPFVGVGIAFADERIQTFIPGRTGMLMDVMLDSLGVAFGLLLVLLVALFHD